LEIAKRAKLEIWLVLALSLGQSAIYSILSFVIAYTSPKGIGGSTTSINGNLAPIEWQDFSFQFLQYAFQFAPVALAIYLAGSIRNIGLNLQKLPKQLVHGLALAASIGIPGLGLYWLARTLGLSAQVITAPDSPYWWTPLMLLMAAATAAVLEETIMVGFIFRKLNEVGRSANFALWLSAIIRASYHLYQGLGGFVGNLVMGLVFGKMFQKTGRLLPLIFAHFLLDTAAFLGYPLAKAVFPWL